MSSSGSVFQLSEATAHRKHSVLSTTVGQFSDGQPVLVRARSNPRTTAHTLRFNQRFIRGHDEMRELGRGHRQSILPLRNKRLFNSAQSFIWRTDEVSGQETHCRHIVFTAVSALVTGPCRLTVPGDWERITLLAVGAFRDGPGAQPSSATKQHQHSSG